MFFLMPSDFHHGLLAGQCTQMVYANITLRQETALRLCYCTVFPKQAMHVLDHNTVKDRLNSDAGTEGSFGGIKGSAQCRGVLAFFH